ncbi:MAG: hypothetical protein ABIN36_16520, partial [Ferruginibacter sp.]
MKKIIFVLALYTGAAISTHAQYSNKIQDPFDVSPENFKRQYFFELGNGNRAEIKLTEISNLDYLKNVDSLLEVVVKDLMPLRDSFADPLASRRIQYMMDAPGLVKIRIQNFPGPASSDYIKSDGVIASLKITQDSLFITGRVRGKPASAFFPLKPAYDYYRICFYLNDINDLAGYMDGRLNEKVARLHDNLDKRWIYKKGKVQTSRDSTITAMANRGRIGGGDLYIVRFSVDAQNYKYRFVPSATISGAIVSSRNLTRREFAIGTEFHFLFSNDIAGKTHSYPNLFITVSYGSTKIDPKAMRSAYASVNLLRYISLAYLVDRKGEFYDKHSFKIGIGRFSLFGGSTRVEPGFYFSN